MIAPIAAPVAPSVPSPVPLSTMSNAHATGREPVDVSSAGADGDGAAAAPLTDGELRTLLLRARAGDDVLLRRLVTGYLTLRRVTADVIAFVEAREGGAAVAGTPLLRRARALADAPRR